LTAAWGTNLQKVAAFFPKYGIFCAFTLLTAIVAVTSPPFRTLSNIENILQLPPVKWRAMPT
jgi:hypothetical protein